MNPGYEQESAATVMVAVAVLALLKDGRDRPQHQQSLDAGRVSTNISPVAPRKKSGAKT